MQPSVSSAAATSAARSAARPSPSSTYARTDPSTAARWPCRICSVSYAVASTHAPSRSLSAASCAVGQARPAPTIRTRDSSNGSTLCASAALDRVGEPGDVLAVQRVQRRDCARVARGVTPRPLDLRRADDDLVDELRERRVGIAGHEPHVAAEGALGFDRQRGLALVRDADHDVGRRRRP